MREYEKPVFEEFSKYQNVKEVWPLYDSIVICPVFYGTEVGLPGWFTSFAAFGAREQHVLYKGRTEAVAGEQYCNMKNADTMDFAFIASSIGLEITGPPTLDTDQVSVDGGGVLFPDAIIPQWWAADFPRHCGLQFKVQQDIRLELPALSCPPGYGVVGGGTSFESAAIQAFGDIPFMTNAVSDGTPLLSNRYPFAEPIGIPRTATIEVVLTVGQWARNILTAITGPRYMLMNSNDGTPGYRFARPRYVIRVSLFGQRLVQQRGEYHR